ncbi:unnamed protein product [Lepidochelys kempii]
MTPLIIATLNTKGYRMALRRSQVLSYLREGGYSVAFLQETHTDPTIEARWRLEWGDGVYFSHFTTWQAGVATLFSPTLRPEVLGSLRPCRATCCTFKSVWRGSWSTLLTFMPRKRAQSGHNSISGCPRHTRFARVPGPGKGL